VALLFNCPVYIKITGKVPGVIRVKIHIRYDEPDVSVTWQSLYQ